MSRRLLISTTSRIVSLSRSGLLSSARLLFDQMPERDTVAWNAMLAAYSGAGLPSHTISLFSAMRTSSSSPDAFSLTSAIAAAADLHDLRTGEMLHSFSLRSGLCASVPVFNCLVDMYGKCSFPSNAKKVFEEIKEHNEVSWCSFLHGLVISGLLDEACDVFCNMPMRNVIAWNIMIMGFACSNSPEKSGSLFKDMLKLGFKGDVLTFLSLVNSYAELSDPCFGQMIHAFIIQDGWIDAIEVSNSVLSFYARFGHYFDALRIFDSMNTRTHVSWNVMIDMHMRHGDVEGAVGLFWEAPEINIVSWTTMIAGFARNEHGKEALLYFVNMLRNLQIPDDITLGAVLLACASLTVLRNGLMVHGCLVCRGFESFVFVANGLVNMYAKCGDIKSSCKVFDEIIAKDLVSWNAVIFGLALNGWAQKALKVFEDMISDKIQPDKLTFLGLLMACCHSGLVEQGMGFLSSMNSVHQISPDADHVTCAIDMLGRAGRLREAAILLDYFPDSVKDRNAGSWETLLCASIIHHDVNFATNIGAQLMNLEPQTETSYVLLSNLYCFSGQWKEAENIRRAMADRAVRKTPGCTWIEVKEKLMIFISGFSSLGQMVDVHNMLEMLETESRHPSYFGFRFGS